jgi:ABC-type phosphate transport system permease subunit
MTLDVIPFEISDYAVLIVPICFLLDIILTYLFMLRYRKHFPMDTDWSENEANPIARYFWGLYGLEHGSIITGISVLPIILGMTYFCSQAEFFLGFVVGVYYFVFYLHFHAQSRLTKRIRIRIRNLKSVPNGTHT